jgi:hypothetical protein
MAINSVNGNTLLETGLFPPCRAATTGAITLSGLQTIDNVALIAGDRVLVWQQADATTNGIYAASSGTWVRTTDAASNTQFFDGMAVIVAQGSQAGNLFLCTTTDDPVIVGTSDLTFALQSDVLTEAQSATSTSSVPVGTGPKSFATQAGKDFAVNQWLLVYDAGGNAMLGQITSYVGGSLALSVVATSGSGTHADWSIVLTNSQAAAGLMPPVGTGNVTGPGSSTANHLAIFADATGKLLADSGEVAGVLATRNTLLYGDAGAASIGEAALVSGAAPLGYSAPQPSDNLCLSNDGTNATRDFDISPGRWRDDSDVINLQLVAAMVKRLDQAWAAGGKAGSPVGACDTGSKGATQTWHVFLIAKRGLAITQVSRTSNVATFTSAAHGLGIGGTVRSYGCGSGFDGLAVITAVTADTYSVANTGADAGATAVSATADGFDIVASQSYSSPTLPSGWTAKQCLGSLLTDGAGSIRAFRQLGDEFYLASPPTDYNTIPGSTPVAKPLSVPSGLKLTSITLVTASASGNLISFQLYDPDVPALSGPTSFATSAISIGAAAQYQLTAQLRTVTDISRQVMVACFPASGTVTIVTLGWRDPRRRLF